MSNEHVGNMPYALNGPSVKQYLTPKNLDNLPMFNPLSYKAYVHRDTIFPQPPFFQAQGSLQPFRNSGGCGTKPTQGL